MMFAIRKKDNHNQFLASGHAEPNKYSPFDSNVFEEVEIDYLPEGLEMVKEKPIATGKGLKAYLNEIESNMTDAQVEQLFVKMGSFYDLLDQSRFNPMTEAKKDSLIAVMNTKFTNGTAQILTDYINAWKETVRFAT